MRHKTLDRSFVTSVFDIMTLKPIAIIRKWVILVMLVIQKNQNITELTIITVSGNFTFDLKIMRGQLLFM